MYTPQDLDILATAWELAQDSVPAGIADPEQIRRALLTGLLNAAQQGTRDVGALTHAALAMLRM